jgi:hypothetical protein
MSEQGQKLPERTGVFLANPVTRRRAFAGIIMAASGTGYAMAAHASERRTVW